MPFYSTDSDNNGSGCSLLFTTTHIGKRDLSPCLVALNNSTYGNELPELKHIIMLQTDGYTREQFESYDSFLDQASMVPESKLFQKEQNVQNDQVCMFQFTSGTTGTPKIAMLTHTYEERLLLCIIPAEI